MGKKNCLKSPAFSFKGWKFKEWLKGNWGTVKELLKVGLPVVLGWLVSHDVVTTGGVALLGKFLLDTLEYWVKKR